MPLEQLNLAGGIVIEGYQGPTPQRQHKNTDEQAWKELDQSIPDSEEKWKDSRKYTFNDTPRMIALVREAIDPLLKHNPDFIVDANRRIGMIQRIILLAAHEVIRTKAQDADSFYYYVRQLLSRRSKPLKKDTLNKKAREVRKLIEEMDKLYKDKLRSRSFEAILLYAPLIPRYLEKYMNDTERFTKCFRKCKPLGENLTEIQVSLPLYIPFFVCYLLTHRKEPFSLRYHISALLIYIF
ncbi:hypothetical protein M441DRAFT_59145 [Trichoderma asperellum CBS 433.97]|uniref:Uncharacterized protein n=1 Tax=Trichoderma asperellum (strain ATCC 204424 / CBS 433.97 / NBRC 101777) TaxID=1042311 RepID=A0A2T3Z6F9_TRIA4|nr:hypothetical protein M441DRAFT_59145 [Trichoderma asperellum CBS 433.97]PTB40384.1 hypothetical protein M441DRAFT_59145 [Trichoderma asperellum CBS 433.97]